MDELVEKRVKQCFQNEIMQRIVFRILANVNENDDNQLKSLELLSLKGIMTRSMRAYDSEKRQVILALLFGEPLDINDFMDYRFGGRKSKYTVVRNDPEIVLALLEKKLTTKSWYEVTITKTALEISVHGNIIARFPNRENVEYDPFLVFRFARMAFLRRLERVNIQFRGDFEFEFEKMMDYMEKNTDSFRFGTPPENWQTAIEREDRCIYSRFAYVWFPHTRIFQVGFNLQTEYLPTIKHHTYFDFSDAPQQVLDEESANALAKLANSRPLRSRFDVFVRAFVDSWWYIR